MEYSTLDIIALIHTKKKKKKGQLLMLILGSPVAESEVGKIMLLSLAHHSSI